MTAGHNGTAKVDVRDAASRSLQRGSIMIRQRPGRVLALMAEGRTNTEIAGRLVLSDKTVRNHITNLFAKLGDTDPRDAVSLAREAGLGAHSGSLPWH